MKATILDCCCGTGTIPKEAIQIKKTQMTAKEAVETVWACDKNNYPLQVANISMTEPDTIPKKLILCLCNTCADKFCGMGVFDLRKVESPQEKHGACANCNRRDGFNYEVIPKGR